MGCICCWDCCCCSGWLPILTTGVLTAGIEDTSGFAFSGITWGSGGDEVYTKFCEKSVMIGEYELCIMWNWLYRCVVVGAVALEDADDRLLVSPAWQDTCTLCFFLSGSWSSRTDSSVDLFRLVRWDGEGGGVAEEEGSRIWGFSLRAELFDLVMGVRTGSTYCLASDCLDWSMASFRRFLQRLACLRSWAFSLRRASNSSRYSDSLFVAVDTTGKKKKGRVEWGGRLEKRGEMSVRIYQIRVI